MQRKQAARMLVDHGAPRKAADLYRRIIVAARLTLPSTTASVKRLSPHAITAPLLPPSARLYP